MAAANGVRRVWVGLNSLMSTPAVSAVIRERTGADVSLISNKRIMLSCVKNLLFTSLLS